MKSLMLFVIINLLLSFDVQACPIGMLYNGNGCSPPYERNMDDWIREKNEYLDSLGPKYRAPVRSMTAEEVENMKRLQAAKDERDSRIAGELARGVWFSDSSATPDGKLCVSTFAKVTRDDDGSSSGGMVSILGFQRPKSDAWLVFYGTGLPTPRDVKKISITLQQDDEPAQTVQAFNYRYESKIGTIAFAVPGLAAAVEGMRDRQSFKLSIGGKPAMTIQWSGAGPAIGQLKQCAQ